MSHSPFWKCWNPRVFDNPPFGLGLQDILLAFGNVIAGGDASGSARSRAGGPAFVGILGELRQKRQMIEGKDQWFIVWNWR